MTLELFPDKFKATRFYEILRDTFTDAPQGLTRIEARSLLLSLTGTVEQKWQEEKRLCTQKSRRTQ